MPGWAGENERAVDRLVAGTGGARTAAEDGVYGRGGRTRGQARNVDGVRADDRVSVEVATTGRGSGFNGGEVGRVVDPRDGLFGRRSKRHRRSIAKQVTTLQFSIDRWHSSGVFRVLACLMAGERGRAQQGGRTRPVDFQRRLSG
jgi:hypothetical protein